MNSKENRYRKTTVRIPIITPSEHYLEIKKKNEQIMFELEQKQNHSSFIKKWFKKL